MSQIQVDNIYNKEATGSPSFPLGANVTGVITATTFKGGAEITSGTISATSVTAASGTFNGPVTIGGTLTYEDVTNIDSVGVITARNGINVSGGIGTFAGNINVSGNINANGNIVGDNSTNISGVSSVTATNFYGNGASLSGIEAAPTFQATASGAIANGKTIVLNSDGTVSAAATTFVGNSVGSEVEITSPAGGSRMLNSVWISDTKFVVIWVLRGSPQTPYMAVGTVSGTTITYGTAVQVDSIWGYSAGIIWDKSVNAGFVAIGDSWNGTGKGYGFTVSGTTLTIRAANSSGYWTDGGDKRCIRVASNGKGNFAMVYITSSGEICTRAGTINSSADISVGSVSNTSSGYKSDGNLFGKATCDIAYNPDLGSATSSSFGVFAINVSNQGAAAILSDVNQGGTSHTLNGFTALVGGMSDSPGIALTYNTEFNCFYSVYRIGSSNYSRTWTAQSNGTTVQDLQSLEVQAANAAVDYYGVDYSPTTKKAYIALATGSKIQGYEVSFASNSSITVSSLQPLTAANTDTNGATISANNTKGKIYVAVSDPSSPYYVKSHIWQTEIINTNVTANNFLGFSAAAYTNGQTVTIKTVGNVDANQTGLTTATKYYLTTGGNLSETPDDPSVYAGLALNSTSIAVKFPV